jgi:hypothetical protein
VDFFTSEIGGGFVFDNSGLRSEDFPEGKSGLRFEDFPSGKSGLRSEYGESIAGSFIGGSDAGILISCTFSAGFVGEINASSFSKFSKQFIA